MLSFRHINLRFSRYHCVMPKTALFLVLGACICAPSIAFAGKVTAVHIKGLDEPMTENLQLTLSVMDSLNKDVTERRFQYLLNQIEAETREALEPFGYYSPKVTVQRSSQTDVTELTIIVDKGDPVRVRKSDIKIEGEGGDDMYLEQEVDAFFPQVGDVFDQEIYEGSKARITRRLAERGYFDADFLTRRVEVTRAELAADIDLSWQSGNRYDMGKLTFIQTPKKIIRDGLVEKLVYWNEGDYYHQGRLDRLRESLNNLGYFSGIDIEAKPEEAVDYRVPVTITLTPAKRSVYTAGISYGTFSGAGVKGSIEKRYLNDRGHKALADVDWARRRKTATLQYRIPAFRWLDGWYTFSLQGFDEQTDYINNRRLHFVASRSGNITPNFSAIVSMNALRERWNYTAEEDGNPDTKTPFHYANAFYPAFSMHYTKSDDPIFPRSGIGLNGEIRAGMADDGSDKTFFAQLYGSGRYYMPVGLRNRLIARGELGYSKTKVEYLPPALRFYAGGDRSIRGYGWREVGPRIGEGKNAYPTGATKLITASIEYEHYLNDKWGGAVFIDTGSAFNDKPDMRTGVGFGVRWRSPVGPVRFDIARGLNNPDSAFGIYLNIGSDL